VRSGAAAGHAGYFHETALYASDEELLGVVVPFLRGGQEAGEPTLAVLAPGTAALARDGLGDTDGVTFVGGEAAYANPAQTIADYRARFAALVARGATQIRVVGDVPHPGTGADWHAWARYEAAINHAYADFPLWGLCPYDVRITPDDVLDDVLRTHPHIASACGAHRPNAAFEDPRDFLAARPLAPVDPLERRDPDLEQVDPTPAAARRAIEALARRVLSQARLDDLLLAVSEIVANAGLHGRAPVVLRARRGADRVVVSVADAGPGPADPFAGLLAQPVGARPHGAGMGLWIAHLLCTDVALRREAHGFTVRLTMAAG